MAPKAPTSCSVASQHEVLRFLPAGFAAQHARAARHRYQPEDAGLEALTLGARRAESLKFYSLRGLRSKRGKKLART